MELRKRLVHMNRMKGKNQTLITSEGDYNLPDVKPDMERILMRQGEVVIDGLHSGDGQAEIRGRLLFDVLYSSAEQDSSDCFSGSMSFEETVPFPGLETNDQLTVGYHLEDLSVEMIHSRKLRAAAAISFEISGESLYDAEAAVAADGEGEPVESREERLNVVELAVQKKDTYRVSEEMELPGNRPNISRILWSSVQLRGAECRPMDGKVAVSGELTVFVLYSGEEAHIPLQWLERTFPFDGELDCAGSRSGQVPQCTMRILHRELSPGADYDGEMRVLSLEAALEVQLRLYEENEIPVLVDLYLPGKILEIETGQAHFENLLIQNCAKCRVNEKLALKTEEKILQICSSRGVVRVDRVVPEEGGLRAEGAIGVTVLYLTDDDHAPLRATEGSVPFSHLIEVRGWNDSCEYRLNPVLEQLSTVMVNGEELEVKAVLSLDTLVLQDISRPIVRRVTAKPIPEEVLAAMPGLIGYIVQPNDTLWDVAKRYYTTTDRIMAVNQLTGEELKAGDRLLIRKKTEML